MASISSTGIGSGLDIAGIVQSLVAAEGQPVETRIAQQEARAQAKLSAFGGLKAALAEFRDKLEIMKTADRFLVRKAISGNEAAFTVTAGTDATPANYSIEVVQLAQSQRLTSGAFADSTAAVGTGTLTLSVGSATADVEISAENNSLTGIRDAINAATDNPGVSATIVNADSGSYLILTADDTGAEQQITVTQTGGDGGLAALEYDPGNGLTSLTESVAAQDALIRIDGLDVRSDSNVFAGAVQGVTITAAAETGGATESLSVVNDTDATKQLVADFVESYNALIDVVDAITDYNAETEIAAPLIGDSTVRGIRDQIRRELSTAVKQIDADFSMLGEVGVEVQLDGKLSVNDDRLSTVLSEDFAKFGDLFSTTDGFGVRLFDLAEGYLDSDGIIETRSKGIETTIEGLADERDSLNERLASFESRLLRQFNALDSLLAQLQSTSNFLTQQLANLPTPQGPNSSN